MLMIALSIVGWLLSRNNSRVLRASALAKDVIEAHMKKKDTREKVSEMSTMRKRNAADICRRRIFSTGYSLLLLRKS